jgi:hypothetical protein
MPRPSRIALALLVTIVTMAPSAGAATPSTEARGSWATNCATQDVETTPGATFPLQFRSVCTGTVAGTWNGHILDYTSGSIDADASQRIVHDMWITGRSANGSCGVLHIRATTTVDGVSRAVRTSGRIVSGSGGWTGAAGSYSADGVSAGTVGLGSYKATWTQPSGSVCQFHMLPPISVL